MAISAIQTPDNLSPIGNPLDIVVDSTNKGNTDFRYILTISTGGSIVARLKAVPIGVDGYGVFDVSQVLGDQVTYKWQPFSGRVYTNATESYTEFQFDVGEEYKDGSGNWVTTLNVTTLDPKTFTNMSLPHQEWVTYNSNRFTQLPSDFLTDSPSVVDVWEDENYFLNRLTNTTSFQQLLITTVDFNDTILGEYTVPFSNDTVAMLSVGPNTLNNATNTDLSVVSGPLDPINENVKYYNIRLQDSIQDETSPLVRINVKRCGQYSEHKVRLFFLNYYGAFDSVSFDMKNYKRTRMNRQRYRQGKGSLSGIGVSYETYDRETTDFKVEYDTEYELNSDWLTDKEFQWLEQLVTSPVVFYQSSEWGLVACNITDNEYRTRRKQNNKTNQLNLRVGLSLKNQRQLQ